MFDRRNPLTKSILARAVRGYFRIVPFRTGKGFVWGFQQRRLAGLELTGSSRFGSRFVCNLGDMIPERIFFLREWEPNLTAFLKRRLGAGDVFVDVGANIGYFSLLAGQLVGPHGAVVAIEASPSIYRKLSRNLTLNAARNIRAVNAAIGPCSGIACVYPGPAGNSGRTNTVGSAAEKIEARVKMETLQAVLSAQEAASARMIKIDVEGAELPLLENILGNISIYRHDIEIAVEMAASDTAERYSSVKKVFELFHAVGFNAYELDNSYELSEWLKWRNPIKRPRPLCTPPITQTDVVFSRTAVGEL